MAGAGAVWVANVDDRTLSRVDPATLQVTKIVGLGFEPTDLAADDEHVWVAGGYDHALWRVDRVHHTDPDILGGTPVFQGTRVPVQTLLDYLEGGHTLDEFLDGFPGVTREQAVAFLEMAKDALLTAA